MAVAGSNVLTMTNDQPGQDTPTSSDRDDEEDLDSESPLSPNAEGHLRLLRAYFGFQAYVGLVALVLVPFAPLLGEFVKINGNPLVAVPMVAVSTWAAFRTRRLLLERDRDGAWMAGLTFVWNLITARTAGYLGFGAFLSGLGVILATNVYWQLRRSELVVAAERPDQRSS